MLTFNLDMLANGTIAKGGVGSDLLWAAQGAGASLGVILSMTTKTWAPIHPNAVNYTIAIGRQTLDVAAKTIIDIQTWSLTARDDLSLRFALPGSPNNAFSATGYFYGDPAEFNATMKPLIDRLPAGTNLTSTVQDFWTLEKQIAPGTGLPDGGSSPARSFYIQAMTVTTDRPLDITAATRLLNGTTFSFNRTDLRLSGLLDLWGGVSREVSDSDYSHQHGKNLWLVRVDGNLVTAGNPYPADGVSYMQSLTRPFVDYLVQQRIPLRGFGNYRDTALTIQQWSERLYGNNWPRLLAVKRAFDPTGLFTSNNQSIPVIDTAARVVRPKNSRPVYRLA